MTYAQDIARHYAEIWGVVGEECASPGGPVDALPEDFAVLRFPPHGDRPVWTYATRAMSQPGDAAPVELHLFTPSKADEVVQILYALAHFHRTAAPLDLEHSVNFGQPWLGQSECSYGLISLPYLDGPALEQFRRGDALIHFYWLIPITPAERAYKVGHGMDALETRFEEAEFDYADPDRPSVV
jgi:hypothetical protein